MTTCNVDVIKHIGKYLNTPVGPVCLNTDRVLTTVLDKENIEGFASIILRLLSKSGSQMSHEISLLSYQWLEHIAMYGHHAASNPTFASSFLKDIDKALSKNTYLTGQFLTVVDVAVYHVLYPVLERLTAPQKEALLHLSRWTKHVQAQPKVCGNKPPLPLNILNLSIFAPMAH